MSENIYWKLKIPNGTEENLRNILVVSMLGTSIVYRSEIVWPKLSRKRFLYIQVINNNFTSFWNQNKNGDIYEDK